MRAELAKTRQFFDKGRSPDSRPSPVQQHIFAVTAELIRCGGSGSRAVDVGCHWGRYTKVLAGLYQEVIGVDFSEKALAAAEKGPNISYVGMDLNSQGAELGRFSPVDFFFANAVLEMLADPSKLCEQMFASGSRNARVLVLIPNRRSLNYVTFRAALRVATTFFGKKGGIYNNGITVTRLVAFLTAAGFEVERKGAIIGVPAYALGLLPASVQRQFLKLDATLLCLLGGSYHWVLAKKTLRMDGDE